MIKQKLFENEIISTNPSDIRRNEIGKLRRRLELEKIRLKKLGINTENDVLSDQNIAEILGTHPTPLTHSLFCTCFAHNGAIKIGRNIMGYDIGEELDQGFQIMVGGQPRCSIVHDALSYRIKGIPLEDYSKIVNYYLKRIEADPQLANYPEIILYEQDPDMSFLENIFDGKAPEYKAAYGRFFNNIHALEKETGELCKKAFIPSWRKKIKKLEIESRKAKTIPEKDLIVKKIVSELQTDACVMFVLVARMAFSSYAKLKRELSGRYGETQGKRKLDLVTTSGKVSEYNPTTRLTLELYNLRQGETALKNVIEEFGHIGLNELEIKNPRYWECPELLQAQAESITVDPEKSFKSVQNESVSEEKEIVKEYPELTEDIRKARTYFFLRESVKFEYLRGYDLIRKILKDIERELGWTSDMIFFLTIDEVMELSHKTKEIMLRKAQNRKCDFDTTKDLYVPTVLECANIDLIGQKHLDRRTRILKGLGATDKVIEGEVLFLDNPYDITTSSLLKPGKILVAEKTDPSWTSYIGAVAPNGGLITEIGGFGSHGAVVSREFGIAAVVGVSHATKILKTGMRVRLDGINGVVEIL